MSKRLWSVFGLFLVMGFSSFAHAEWVSFDGKDIASPNIEVSQTANDLTRLDITMTGIDTRTVTIEGSDYTQVRIPGEWFSLEKGQPELPFITSSLIIPDAGTPQVRIVKSTWREVAAHPVLPSKGNLLRTEDPATVPYTFGPVYHGNGIFPAEVARLADPFIMRDYRGVSLRIHAVRWDAQRGVLLALESMTLEVETSGTGGINPKQGRMRNGMDAQFANLYRLGFDNFANTDKYNMVAVPGRMLVVCNDAFMGVIQPFVEWKRSTGLDVELISTGSVGGTTSGIQGAIDTRYAEPEGLTYVILVGDLAQVPTYSGTYEGADDDTRYANQEGSDLYPDLFVSRISGSNPTDIQTQINKFVRYERNPDADGDWYHIGAGLASSEGSPTDYERAEWLRQDMLNYNFTQVHEIYQPSGSSSDIANAVNAGVSLVNYIGHGSGTSWSNPPFGISNVHALSNGWKTPWVVDVSCSNGDFSMSECYAEAWMRAGDPTQPDGAVAMYSASTSTPWVPPCVMQAEIIDLMVADQANVIGSLYYHGIMKMMDEYPGDSQVVEQYNIFGDCSLMIRTDTPIVPAMSHADVLALGATTFPVDTGVANTRVAITSSNGLHGVGVTDASGHVDLVLDNPVTVAGEVTMTVTGYNLLTQVIFLQAIVPVVVDIQPASIPVGETTEVTVTLMDPPAAKAISNVTITIEGFGVSGLEAVTGDDGIAVFSVTPQYGETLIVRGEEAGTRSMFTEDLPVTGALTLDNAAVAAQVVSIGMTGTLTPHLEGLVTGDSDVADFDMRLVGCGLDLTTVGTGNHLEQNATPTSTGTVVATLLKIGYNLFQADISVVAAYGTLTGTVTDADNGGAVVAGVRVYGFNAGDDPSGEPLFDLVTNASGVFSVSEDLPVGDYDLYASKFGYLDHLETYFLMFGANDHGIAMNLAPNGVLTGVATSSEDGSPVIASIEVFRSDTGELVASVSADETGAYTTGALTYFSYNVVVKAFHFMPQTVAVSISLPSTVKDFLMVPTSGNVLIVDDNSVLKEFAPAKLGKNGVVIAEGYALPGNRDAADILTDLTTLGFSGELVNSSSYNYADWFTYDMVIVSAGSKTSSLGSGLVTDMINFVAAGGQLMIEGGEVGYNHRNDSAFCANVLHISNWVTDSAGDLTVDDPTHYVMSVPNTISGPVSLSYSGYGDSDAVVPASDASRPGGWSSSSGNGSVICYDPSPAPQAGQIVFFAFAYSSLGASGRSNLLHNAVVYLTTPEIGNSTITGQVQVSGTADNSGVTVSLTPGSDTFLTGPDGSYSFDLLVAGDYHLTAVLDGYSVGVADVTIATGETVEQNFVLKAIVTNDFCDSPDVNIPDNDPEGGVYCPITINKSSALSGIRVYVDISHTYVADMVFSLISPSGTTVTLHKNQGGDGDNVIGWYPTELTPFESLDVLLGEPIQGTWQLHVTDVGPQDFGHVNSWCLSLTYEDDVVSAAGDETLPKVLAANGNYPNPFNPMTVIRFSVPVDQGVELAVYDVRGVRVRSLVSDVLTAGHHEATWMGRDDNGRAVASGTYFYRLTSGGQSVVGKMLLMK